MAIVIETSDYPSGTSLEFLRSSVGKPMAIVIETSDSPSGTSLEFFRSSVGKPMAIVIETSDCPSGTSLEFLRSSVGKPMAIVIETSDCPSGTSRESATDGNRYLDGGKPFGVEDGRKKPKDKEGRRGGGKWGKPGVEWPGTTSDCDGRCGSTFCEVWGFLPRPGSSDALPKGRRMNSRRAE